MDWIIDLEKKTATNGYFVVKFERNGDGTWDGKPVTDVDNSAPSAIARQMREAGEAFIDALRRQAAAELGRLGGSATTKAKKKASRQNGKLGGRPKKAVEK